MPVVNYLYLRQILSILQFYEITGQETFGNYDPDDDSDLSAIVQKYIEHTVRDSAAENQEELARTIAFYSESGSAPFQEMRDDCQELSLQDPASWPLFYHRVGSLLFGENFRERFSGTCVEERPSEGDASFIFWKVPKVVGALRG